MAAGNRPAVQIEREEPILVVTIDRPGRRNAVDLDTAQQLRRAFSDFDSDPELLVAILTSAGGTFCAGFDLKALSAGQSTEAPDPDHGPMGPTRMALGQAGDRGGRRLLCGWRSGAGPLV